MKRFIYCFGKEARDIMLASGFELIKEDANNDLYVFNNNNALTFSLADKSFVYSDMLSF